MLLRDAGIPDRGPAGDKIRTSICTDDPEFHEGVHGRVLHPHTNPDAEGIEPLDLGSKASFFSRKGKQRQEKNIFFASH